jgi:hypothetical protein
LAFVENGDLGCRRVATAEGERAIEQAPFCFKSLSKIAHPGLCLLMGSPAPVNVRNQFTRSKPIDGWWRQQCRLLDLPLNSAAMRAPKRE